jgi:hypothetical protein
MAQRQQQQQQQQQQRAAPKRRAFDAALTRIAETAPPRRRRRQHIVAVDSKENDDENRQQSTIVDTAASKNDDDDGGGGTAAAAPLRRRRGRPPRHVAPAPATASVASARDTRATTAAERGRTSAQHAGAPRRKPDDDDRRREESPTLGAGTLTRDERARLLEHYYNIDNPAALTSSPRRLYKALRRQLPSLTVEKCRFFLQTQSPYTLTASRRTYIPRNRMEVYRCFDMLACDIMIMRKFFETTESECYCLLVVDVFSRFTWGLMLKTRTAQEITTAFEQLLEQLRPRLLRTTIYFDRESAIISSQFAKMIRKFDVQLQFSYTETKVSHAEILIRYLRRSLLVY